MKKIHFVWFGLIMVIAASCGASKDSPAELGYSLRPTAITELYNDTVPNDAFKALVRDKKIPPLRKMTESALANYEENKGYRFYAYFDKKNDNMITVKQLVEQGDTAYIIQIKNLKQ